MGKLHLLDTREDISIAKILNTQPLIILKTLVKKFIGILEEKNQIKWLNYIDELYGSEHSFSHKTAFIEKAADSSFYVLGNRSVFAEELIPSTYLAKFDISGNELWRINNHAYNEI